MSKLTKEQVKKLQEIVMCSVHGSEGVKKMFIGCEFKIKSPQDLEVYDSVFTNDFKDGNNSRKTNSWECVGLTSSSSGSVYTYHFVVGKSGFSNCCSMISVDGAIFEKMLKNNKINILGLPPTLSRVLKALNKTGRSFSFDKHNIIEYKVTNHGEWKFLDCIPWKDIISGKDQDLLDQSEETQMAVFKILTQYI